MDPWVVLAGIFGPVVFWVAYIYYYNDRERPEPIALVGLSYLAGVGSAFLCLKGYEAIEILGLFRSYWETDTPARPAVLAYMLGLVGPLEELAKFLPFALLCLRLRAFDEVVDGVVYASAVALGFASYENLFYLPTLQGAELYARAFASPFVHTLFSSIWGYACARAKIDGRPLWRPALLGLFFAALLHGLYDFLSLDPALRIGAAASVLALWIWRARLIARLLATAGPPPARRPPSSAPQPPPG